MFKIAGVRCMRGVFFALSIGALAVLLGACAHSPMSEESKQKSWVVERVNEKSTAELYEDLIAPAVFERSSSKVIDGYTVESGNLLMPDKTVGSLVTVRSGSGSLTAFIESSSRKGVLVINSKGESRFTPYTSKDYSILDTVPGEALERTVEPAKAADEYAIDMLIVYSREAVLVAGGDATSNALAQVESVNLALRNSLVNNVFMRLAGVQIVNTNYSMTTETLRQLPGILSVGTQAFRPDMFFGVFAPHPDDTAAGWGTTPGRAAIGHVSDGWIFRHEIGDNLGGIHCPELFGGYKFGFNNGKSGTIQCGEDSPFYSTPQVKDAHGLPRGNVITADMSRMWRESGPRLSYYALPFVGERFSFQSLNGSSDSILEIRMPARYQAGVVALNSAEGPTELAPAPKGYARLTVKLKNDAGDEREVNLRAERFIGGCEWFAMNAYVACPFSGSTANKLYLKLSYNVGDNPTLPASVYNGVLRLEARNLLGSWRAPVVVLMSIAGGR